MKEEERDNFCKAYVRIFIYNCIYEFYFVLLVVVVAAVIKLTMARLNGKGDLPEIVQETEISLCWQIWYALSRICPWKGDFSRGWLEDFLFNSYYTEV